MCIKKLTPYLTVILIILLGIVIFIGNYISRSDPYTDYNVNITNEKIEMCCQSCLTYGNQKDTKDCLEIIKENGGLRHCFLVLEDTSYTYSQCKKFINN